MEYKFAEAEVSSFCQNCCEVFVTESSEIVKHSFWCSYWREFWQKMISFIFTFIQSKLS